MKIFATNFTTQRGVSSADLRNLARNEPEMFIRKIQQGADEGKLRLGDLRHIDHLYDALCDVPVKVQMTVGKSQREITTSAFPILTGILAIAGMNDAFNAVETIGQELVTDFEDNKKVTTMAQLSTLDSNIDEVKEGKDFPEIGTNEEKVEIRHKRNGRKLTISAEAIEENEMPDIVSRINQLGEIANEWIEEQTLYRVTDHYGSAASPLEPYVYRPGGTGTTLFSSTANTPGTRAPLGNRITNNAYVDETDLEAARVRLASMRNARGTRIYIPRSEVFILCPDAIVGNVLKTINSEYVPGVENEVSNFGPRGKFHIPVERVISSPKLDDLSTSAWYYGAFKRQFKRKWKLKFEFVNLGQDTQAYLNSRIAAQFRIAWDMEVGAVDYPYVIQNLSATTAPADE